MYFPTVGLLIKEKSDPSTYPIGQRHNCGEKLSFSPRLIIQQWEKVSTTHHFENVKILLQEFKPMTKQLFTSTNIPNVGKVTQYLVFHLNQYPEGKHAYFL